MSVNKIVLAYSGGLDTSVILKWLIETYKAEVIAYIADVGQQEDLEAAKEKAYNTGASKVYIEDLKDEFVKDYVFMAIKADAVYEGRYLLGTSLARPIIAKGQIEVAIKEGADAVSHGATGKGNDQVRFELTYTALAPQIKIIAPWRIWDLTSRSKLVEFAQKHNIPVPVTKEKPYSIDRNLMHTSYEGGILEDPNNPPKEDMFTMTVSPQAAPDNPEIVKIDFEKGVPVAVNDKRLSPADLLAELNTIAGRNAIGRVDIVENRFVGIKSRGVYETPGATLLHFAHRELESLTLEKETYHYKEQLALEFANLTYYGFWFHPKMDAIKAFIEQTQEVVNGSITLKLYKGNISVEGRQSPNSLYNMDIVTFEEGEGYNQQDATGFIKLQGISFRGYKQIK